MRIMGQKGWSKDIQNKKIRKKKCFKFSPSYKFEYIESWLNKLSKEGWRLEKCSFFSIYTFIPCKEELYYFMFSLDPRGRGEDWIYFAVKDKFFKKGIK